MVKIAAELSPGDIMELLDLINHKQQEMLTDGYENVEWDYYFCLNELQDKLVK